MMKRMLSWFLVIALTVGCVPVSVWAESALQMQTYTVQTAAAAEQEEADGEELLEGYAYQLFYGGVETYGRKAGDRLSGDEKLIYDALVPIIKQIAAGERTSSVIGLGETVSFNDETYVADVPVDFTIESISNETMSRINAALLTDMPYEMYWYDKVSGVSAMGLFGADCKVVYLQLSFHVSDNYQGAEAFTVDCADARAAATAAKNSAAIVAGYGARSDYEKLVGYKNEICDLVTYNYDAAYTGNFSLDNDPWQLIYVFDGDETTNVVCEGYSKAFAYLCEQTAFDGDIYCITASGQMGGPHMWNIVSIEGKSYLVDVTNSDAGTVGVDGRLFLSGGTGNVMSGYTVASYYYSYFDQEGNSQDILLWGADADSILTLAAEKYIPKETTEIAGGACGENVTWSLDSAGTLTISGTGDMYHYNLYDAPWYYFYAEEIRKVVINPGVTGIGAASFLDCVNLSAVAIPQTVTLVSNYAFSGCSGLRNITLPESLTEIGIYAFSACDSLTSLEIPAGVEYIGENAFYNCGNMEGILVDPQNAYYSSDESGVLLDKNQMVLLQAPGGLRGNYQIPEGVTTINKYAFAGCNKLITVTIPRTTTEIPEGTFSETNQLQSIWVDANNPSFCNDEIGVVLDKDLTTVLHAPGGLAGSYTVPEGVQKIGAAAFCGCGSLTAVVIPEGVTELKLNAFTQCENLTAITLPITLKTVDFTVFNGCDNLQHVYYAGTLDQWDRIKINRGNDPLLDAKLHYAGMHEHTLVQVEAAEPTCTQVGWQAYEYCETCDYTTYEEIPALGHSYVAYLTPSTCQTQGYYTYACDRCEYSYVDDYMPLADHRWSAGVVTIQPTEQTPGEKTYTCIWCPATKTEELPIIQHTHSYQSVVTPATCEEGGYTTHTCACGDSYVDTPVAAMGHNMGKWSVTVPAECNTAGTQIRTCTRCDYEESEQISPTGKHNYVPTVTPPTCTQQGYTTYTCTCGDKYIDDYVEPAGHAYGDWVDVKAPTCLLPGTQNRTCSLCFTVQAQTVPATGHKYNPTEVVAPTYSAGGYTVYTCVCGDSYTDDAVKPLTLPKLTIQVAGGMLQWEYEPSVDQFEIYRATSKSGKYTKIGTAIDHDYQDTSASVGKTYYYKVRAIIGYDAKYNSGYSNVVSIAYKCAEPELVLTTNTSGKPVLTWNKVSGAKKYEVYRATSETGKYTKVTTVTKTTYTDSKASTGTRYFYKIKAVASSSTYNSGYSNITSCWIICATPAVTTKIDTSTGRPGFTWSAVSGAVGYRIYRRLPGVTNFEEIAQVTGKSFTDTTAAIDTQYEYRVQAVGKSPELDSAKTYSMFVTSGLAQPKVTGTVNDQGKPEISWPAVDGAVKYTIYRSTSSSKNFKAVETVADLSYTDTSVAAGKTYYYKVSATGQNSVSSSSAALKLTGKCAIPELSVEAGSTGKPVLTWNKISGAKKYEIWRSVDGAAFKKLTTVTKTTYTDTKATNGAECTYKVKALASSSSNNGNFSEVKGCKVICAAPSLSAKVDTASGKPSLSWSKVTGATGYAIYRNGELLTTITGVSYLDTTAETDAPYSYYVVSVGKTEDFNSIASATKAVTATVGQPKIKGTVNEDGKPVITWDAVEDAVKYIVYRSTSSSKSYKEIATITDLTYVDTSVAAGKTYYYKVMAVGENSKGAQSAYVKLTGKCDIPTLNVEAGTTGKPVLSWNKISGAKKYEIWRSVDGAAFKKLTTVTKTTYTDTKATEGAQCTYKVKALGSKSSYNGLFSEELGCYVTCAAPSLTAKVDTATGKPSLSWKKVTGAVAYAIYRDGELLTTVTGTSYKDEAVTPGVKYSYTLVSLGKMEVFNSVESAAKTATATCAQPKLTGSLDPATGKPVLTWGAVEGAEGYAIYRSTSKSSGYKKIGTAEENTYLDTAATAKKTYYYKVEALAGSTKSSQSSYVKLKCGSGPIPVKVTAVEISGPSQVMVGNKITLTAAVTPENAANKAVTWSISSGSSYASISSDGVLTAKKIGTVKVKATAKDGSGKSDTYTVAVVKKTLWEGSGTKSNPYLLRTVDDLLKLSEVLGQSGLYFKQVADIDCASVADWIAIGTEDKPFRHNIDGGGYTISNICLDGEAGALIAYATDAAFTNMKIANAYTTENGVTNRHSTNTAALVGYGVGCSFENCSAAVDFKQGAVVTGGLAGYIVLKRGQKDLMTNCAVTGRISGGGYVGGLVGQIGRSFYGEDYADNQSTGIRIVDSRADVQIQSDGVGNSRPAVGGLAGEANLINIESSYTTGAIVAISGDVGGLVGYTLYATEIIRCYSEMEITCTTNSEYGGVSAGGLIGQMVAYAVVHDCYATGNVNLPNGGWSPCQDSTSVNGGPWLGYYNPCGSLIGSIKMMSIYDSKYYQIELYNCYATGTVNAPKICEDERVYCHGALVGLVLDNHTRRHITDTTKADQSDWAGFSKTAIYRFESNYNLEALRTYYTPLNEYKKANTYGMYNPVYSAMPSHEYVQIVTENQMKNVETFAGWDFETVWQMTANGPTLR